MSSHNNRISSGMHYMIIANNIMSVSICKHSLSISTKPQTLSAAAFLGLCSLTKYVRIDDLLQAKRRYPVSMRVVLV